jgi:tRNA G10  N-methylase Trm11
MRHLKLFEDFESVEYLKSEDKEVDIRTEEDKKLEIEDIVSTELSDEGWTLISKEYKNVSGSNVYSFKFNTKSKSNLYLTLGRSQSKEKYINSDIFNKEIWEIEKILKHTLLHDIGYYAKVYWIDDYGWDYYTDGVYSGQTIHRAIIVVDIIEPSWWRSSS